MRYRLYTCKFMFLAFLDCLDQCLITVHSFLVDSLNRFIIDIFIFILTVFKSLRLSGFFVFFYVIEVLFGVISFIIFGVALIIDILWLGNL